MSLLLLLACTSASITGTLPAAGGTLELPGGASLELPEGALSEDVEVTATLITDIEGSGYQGLPEWGSDVSFAIALEPHGLTFAKPATLRVPHGGWSDKLVAMHTDDSYSRDWQGVGPLTEDGEFAVLEIEHFSLYAYTPIPDGSCPCFDADDLATYYRVARVEKLDESYWEQDSIRLHQSKYSGTGKFALVDTTDEFGSRCRAHAIAGKDAAALFAEFFPALSPTSTGGSDVMRQVSPLTPAQVAACGALISRGYDGSPAAPLEASVSGLDAAAADARVTLVNGSNTYVLPGGLDTSGLLELDVPYTLQVSESPDGYTCTLVGADATGALTGTPEDDGSPVTIIVGCIPSASNPVPTEVDCNGLDDDGDDEVDEGFPDTDGDGIHDACDSLPTQGCGCFTVGDVRSYSDDAGGVCYENAALQAVEGTFTGALVELGPGATYAVAGLVKEDVDSSTAECGLGCFDRNGNAAACTPTGYPDVSIRTLTGDELAACAEVIDAACE